MDLSHPERTLVGRLDLPLLVTLARADREWTSPRLAEAVGATPVGVRQALARLAAAGLVRVTTVGQAQGYRLNTSHVMADVVVAMASASARLRTRIVEEVAQWELPTISLVLFGSWARGEAGPDSDVDLLFVHERFDARAHDVWDAQLDALRAAIRAWSGNDTDLLSFTEDEWLEVQRRGDPLAASLAPGDTILLHGRPLPRPAGVDRTEVASR